jgi:hypothetical protein
VHEKDKRTMIKLRQFASISEGLNNYRIHLNLDSIAIYMWYDAHMNGDMDTLITELLEYRRGNCTIQDCKDCDKGIEMDGNYVMQES